MTKAGGVLSSDKELRQYVAEGYDDLAPTYDSDVGSNAIGIRMRKVFRETLVEAFHPGDLVLEIGCGTGIDSVWLAQRRFDVVATDISEEMVSQVREKAKRAGVEDNVRPRVLAASEIGRLEREFGIEGFDAAFCHAGALNMEPDLHSVPAQLRALLKPDAPFVCSVINKTSLFELVFYPLVLRPRKAFRRLDNVVPIPISRSPPLNRYVVPTRFYSPSEVIRIFRDSFSVTKVQALQVFLPPSNLSEEYVAVRLAFAPLEALEVRLSGRRPLSHWGHHTIFTFRRG